MSVLEKLTEGIINRDLQREGAALLSKWEKTGLLEGLGDDRKRASMARLLENQAKELLREASSMAAGDVEGFAAVAFPVVRRVFGGLIANDLVSVQPMSLPSGLIFFLDFQRTSARLGGDANDSLFGGGVVGQELTGGVSLTGDNLEKGFYSLDNGYTSPTGSATFALSLVASGVVGGGENDDAQEAVTDSNIGGSTVSTSLSRLVRYDPDLSGSAVIVCAVTGASNFDDGSSLLSQLNRNNLVSLVGNKSSGAANGASSVAIDSAKVRQIRRLTTLVGGASSNADASVNALPLTNANTSYLLVFESTASSPDSSVVGELSTHLTSKRLTVTFPIDDSFAGTPAAGSDSALGAVVGQDTWGLEAQPGIPEIDIKVDSISVTAKTKKLKAKWSPELGQDLNAYHNLDAEVELTSILSEQIALEIDREILEDLIKGASAGTRYWSRAAGRFVNRLTGREIGSTTVTPDFTGTVSEWYETLVETINDVSAQIHRKTLRGGANFLVCSPEVANILEFTAGFRANITHDSDRGTVGTVNVGSLSKKWDVYVDPYFPRNVVLVGRKGGSFLESGYVYSPYVPLQVTPTIFGVEDFVPRKGVMTRYAKKMVRPDMYGLVLVNDLV